MPRKSARAARATRPSRNDDCPCGSGRKYKHCCEQKAGRPGTGARILLALVIAVAVFGIVLAFTARTDPASATGRVWSPEHGHYHDR